MVVITTDTLPEDRYKKIIKALKCRKSADKRCGNPCEESGMCHYAKAVRGLDGEIYKPFVCDKERLCADVISLLEEQDNEIDNLKTLLLGYETGAIKGNNNPSTITCEDEWVRVKENNDAIN